MGIGNTTSASAIVSLLLKTGPEATVGTGTGVDKNGVAAKRKVIYQAFNRHGDALETPLSILQHVGGLEIAALVGAYIGATVDDVRPPISGKRSRISVKKTRRKTAITLKYAPRRSQWCSVGCANYKKRIGATQQNGDI